MEVSDNQGFLMSPLPNPRPHLGSQEIADTSSGGDKASMETRFMTILCTRSYAHLRRGEASVLPFQLSGKTLTSVEDLSALCDQRSQLPAHLLPPPTTEYGG